MLLNLWILPQTLRLFINLSKFLWQKGNTSQYYNQPDKNITRNKHLHFQCSCTWTPMLPVMITQTSVDFMDHSDPVRLWMSSVCVNRCCDGDTARCVMTQPLTKWDLSQEGKVGFKSETQCNTAYCGIKQGMVIWQPTLISTDSEVITCIATE